MEIKGKIINFLGDSITEGVGVENSRYDNVIKRKYELKAVNNYGISGTRIAHQIKATIPPRFDLNFCGRSFDLDPNADITVVFGGTNDYGHGDAPFGEMTDTTPETFCGAVDYLMTHLKEQYPDMIHIFMTPARRVGDLEIGVDAPKRDDAKPLKNYVDVIKAKGVEHNIPVLDLYENLGINPNNPDESEKYTTDGLHFNDLGHAVIADRLSEFIINL